MRRMIRMGLDCASDIEVVGSATTAQEAIELCRALWPDVLTLDLELPDANGLEVLRNIRSMPVRALVVSTFTTDAASERAVEAMTEGAIDCLGKPNLDAVPSVFIAQLLDRVRNIASGAPYFPRHDAVRLEAREGQPARLIVIGTSTGGPRALQALLSVLPAGFPSPVVVVQHIPAAFIGPFTRRLNRVCELDVHVAADGDVLTPGHVYIAPSGSHLHIEGPVLRLRAGSPVNGLMPAIDVTMIDAAATWGDRVTGLVLTGIGQDGREGARAIRTAGGHVIAESELTCAVYGMPRAVVDAGLAHQILPIDQLALRLVEEVAA
ncbi:MAG: chemotaxis-specific protein-glutamate methyltransferase CheB [Thermoleophilia bacterium]|nr:chemotaxis-specific protein-glutamate methyltransferase CheB [Thermoleophilia bacterium]